ncbi:hypothetical protein [Nostoc sp.]|uniref:hypothetical protein n=1 Tax=Nostoc sp. TaxID=1180 RepID=UPI002FF4C6B2
MPAAGYANAIYQRMIDKSLKRRILVDAQDNQFVPIAVSLNLHNQIQVHIYIYINSS